jgi:hypothetical protein
VLFALCPLQVQYHDIYWSSVEFPRVTRELAMIIVVESSSRLRESAVDTELQRAFVALHSAKIRMLGGGRFKNRDGCVVLANDADAVDALAALSLQGLSASVLQPTPSPPRAA